MDRRNFLIGMSSILGCSLSSLDVAAIDSAVTFFDAEPAISATPQGKFISRIADIIIPETDTPSASQAGVGSYIDFYVHECMREAEGVDFLDGLREIYGPFREFLNLTHEEQVAVIQSLDDRLDTAEENPAYKKLKELTVIGYYTSKIGGTRALKYDPVPGPYREVKLADVGGVWM